MPKTCSLFAHLTTRKGELARKFVDDQVQAEKQNPATYTPDLDRLAAYRLLAHAEFEDFIEAKAKENLLAVESSLNAGARIKDYCSTLVPIAMLLRRPLLDPDKIDSQRLNAFLKDVVIAARKAISENNGIKSAAFLLLSLCAGKEIEDVDITLQSSMNSFGKERGDVAHTSISRCQTINAPSVELANVDNIIAQLATYYDVQP